jgi:NTE family protein
MTNSSLRPRKIGVALSGGGVRAAAFHAGVFRWLAEAGLLEQVRHVSSVSGGSLFTGLIYHLSGYCWPTSEQYLNSVYPQLKECLTLKSLQKDAICRLIFNPLNWRFLLSRANVLAQSIEELWGIHGVLEQLPLHPIWSINATTAENGKRFRFKNRTGGDYEIGYADFADFALARAMAVSAAFPGGIGPLTLDTASHSWRKRDSWDSTTPPEECAPPFPHVHLYDGGLYDNLGIEPLFDVGGRKIKESAGDIDFVMVSDAGAPLNRLLLPNFLRWRRLKRFMDIVMDQARALRVRAFVKFLQQNNSAGMYLQIGSDPIDRIKRYGSSGNGVTHLNELQWLSQEEVSYVSKLPTTLKKMRLADFDIAARHGYETTKWNFELFVNLEFTSPTHRLT